MQEDKELTNVEKSFIVDMLNAQFHAANTELWRKDLGDIERKQAEFQKDECYRLMKKLQ